MRSIKAHRLFNRYALLDLLLIIFSLSVKHDIDHLRLILVAIQIIVMVINLKNKKAIFLVFATVIMISQIFPVSAKATDELALDDPLRLNDMVITLLMPPIGDAVNSFYEPYLTIEPTVVPYYGSKIVSIQGGEQIHEGIYNSHYTVTVEVFPYVGPHLAVGKDRITLDVQINGVTVKNYEHVESYTLPTNHQSLIKKPLP